MGHEPIRMCIFCRQRFPKGRMRRFVIKNGKIIVDDKEGIPGRGAYCCDNPACIEQADKDNKGLLLKALKKR